MNGRDEARRIQHYPERPERPYYGSTEQPPQDYRQEREYSDDRYEEGYSNTNKKEYYDQRQYEQEDDGYMADKEQQEVFQGIYDDTQETKEDIKEMYVLVEKQHKIITIFAIAIVFIGVLAGYALLMMDSNSTYHANATNNMVFLTNRTLTNNGVTGLTREQLIEGEGAT